MASTNNSSLYLQDIKLKELFVQNLNGTSVDELMILMPPAVLFTFLASYIKLTFFSALGVDPDLKQRRNIFSTVLVFVLEFLTIVLPIVIQGTVLSDFAAEILLCMIVIAVFVVVGSVSSVNNKILYWRSANFGKLISDYDPKMEKQIFLTVFRSMVFLKTGICILAVDFHVFPRRFAKTETYGVSVMDTGVGLFVMASAVVSRSQTLRRTVYESVKLALLGIVRTLLIQRLDYQQHVTEYGLHWNFFITLALVKLLSYSVSKSSARLCLVFGLLLAIAHQFFLTLSLESYVLSDAGRDSLLGANREGIVSLPGYLSLHLIGLVTAKLFRPMGKRFAIRYKLKTWKFLLVVSIFLYYIVSWLDKIGFKVSRRLVNLPYILHITHVGSICLLLGLLFELCSILFLPIHPNHEYNLYRIVTPAILESINFNALLYFLISNMLTGFVNLSMGVFHMEPLQSIAVLLAYMFVNCTVVYVLWLFDIRVVL